jgi:prevent-host-death family protein
MSVLNAPTRVLSVSEASSRGVAGLVKDSEHGADTVVERHGRPVAAVVSIQHFGELRELEQDLLSAALVLSRAATDNGNRTDLDDVIAAFGFTRDELQQERRDDAAAGRRE